jgi:DNA invertase Pin-like site-specific DNA recombinase
MSSSSTPRAPHAVGYLRVSTYRQADSGLGLEAQQSSVTACAVRLGIPLAAVLTDAGTSGSLTIEDRPVLLDAVASLKRGDVVIVAKRDRLGRDVIAVAMIERLIARRGAKIVSAAGEGTDADSHDPAAMLMRRLIDSFAEYERALIASRTRAALAAKRRRGERISGLAPYGSAFADGRVQPCAAEQSIITLMQARRAAGDSLAAIADCANRAGFRTRTGSPWRREYVHAILRRAA